MGMIFCTSMRHPSSTQITVRSTAASAYTKTNAFNHWNLKHRHRTASLTGASSKNPLWIIDLATSSTIAAVLLCDVNYSKVRIRGHTTNMSTNWLASAFDSASNATVSKNALTGRYNIYIPLTNFKKRWLAIMTPNGTTNNGKGRGACTSGWETGSIGICTTVQQLSANPSYGYVRSVSRPYADIDLPHGGITRIRKGSAPQVSLDMPFEYRPSTDATELWTLNLKDNSQPIAVYENDGTDSQAYIMIRDGDFSVTVTAKKQIRGSVMRFRELV